MSGFIFNVNVIAHYNDDDNYNNNNNIVILHCNK